MTSPNSMEAYTAEQYRRREVSHHEYYLSVAMHSGITAARFSEDMKRRILASTDPHMNDVPLRLWDAFYGYAYAVEVHENSTRTKSLSSTVCAYKAVAREWKAAQGRGQVVR